MENRITRLRTYLFTMLDELIDNKGYQINANFLQDTNNYSIDRLPIDNEVENWIIPIKKYREVYELRSMKSYGADVMENLKNIGFFENLEEVIYSNNKEGKLPEIDGIESIECLNCGALSIAETKQAIFSIQIQINYIKNKKQNITSI